MNKALFVLLAAVLLVAGSASAEAVEEFDDQVEMGPGAGQDFEESPSEEEMPEEETADVEEDEEDQEEQPEEESAEEDEQPEEESAEEDEQPEEDVSEEEEEEIEEPEAEPTAEDFQENGEPPVEEDEEEPVTEDDVEEALSTEDSDEDSDEDSEDAEEQDEDSESSPSSEDEIADALDDMELEQWCPLVGFVDAQMSQTMQGCGANKSRLKAMLAKTLASKALVQPAGCANPKPRACRVKKTKKALCGVTKSLYDQRRSWFKAQLIKHRRTMKGRWARLIRVQRIRTKRYKRSVKRLRNKLRRLKRKLTRTDKGTRKMVRQVFAPKCASAPHLRSCQKAFKRAPVACKRAKRKVCKARPHLKVCGGK